MSKGTIRRALYAAKNLRKHYDDGGVITPRSLAQRIVPPEEYGAVSPSIEGVQEAVKSTFSGAVPAAKATYDYMATTPFPQAIKDVGHVVGSMAESAKENPAEFIGGMMPVIGNIYAAKDLSQLKDKIQEARAAGNEQAAAQMEKMAPLAMAGVLAPFGGGAAARGALKSAERVAARELTPLGLYSHGAETAFGLPQAKGTPEQMAAMLQNQGVKPAELEGFAESFAGQPSITREQAAEFFKGRMPQIEETILGVNPPPIITPERYKELINTFRPLRPSEMDELKAYERHINGEKPLSTDTFKPTRYDEYTIPGGENYREVLLKLSNSWKPEIAEKNGRYGFTGPDGKYRDYWSLNDAEQAAKSMYRDSGSFKSMHWNEPDVLAHIRMADRIGPNGEKILHVEEIQSDWAQQGRKQGFKGQKLDDEIAALKKHIDDIEESALPFTEQGKDAPREIIDQWTSAKEKLGKLEAKKLLSIPEAPYVTNTQGWTDLALKRVLKEAAEGGYDKIVWTPGAEQAKRYDLSKVVDRLVYDPKTQELFARTQSSGVPPFVGKTYAPEDLPNVVGKEVAEKLLSSKPTENGMHVLSGEELLVGGEGMKGYYDKIVPTQLSKLTKKLDPEAQIGRDYIGSGKYEVVLPNGKVVAEYADKKSADIIAKKFDQGKIPGAMVRQGGIEVPMLQITPAMREAILRGFPHYAEGGAVDKYPLRDHTDWEEAHDYEKSGGKLHYESPDKYLENTEPLDMGTKDKRVIQHFEKQMEHGEKMDPVAVLPDGHPNGRHRAHAAKKLGIKKIPVVSWPKKNKGGSIVDRALMLTSKKA